MKKKLLITLSTISFCTLFLSFDESLSAKKDKVLIGAVNEIIATYHYKPSPVNDSLSSHIFDLFIKRMDYGKNYFLQSDITAFETYRYKIDDEIKSTTFNFFELVNEVIVNRTNEAEQICDSILSRPFDFTIKESFETDEEKVSFPQNDRERIERWRKSLKYYVADKIYSLEKNQEKIDSIPAKPFDSLEISARDYVKKKFHSRFSRLKQLERDDRMNIYVNCFTNESDPHTTYFPPKDKENFDISISGKLEGIGATLMEKDGNIKVTRIVPGSASWKQGELQAEDLILKVGQAEEEPVDIVGMRLDEAVRLIRGPKGSLVKLTVKKLDGRTIIIPIVRDVVIIEETYAKSTIITDNEYKKRIGYIYLPKFYVDFNNSNGRRCSKDILSEIKKLKTEKVDGLILDLRNNGGGSLSDVVKIGGYFIKEGPIVQVKSKYVTPKILSDTDPAIQYNGPLVIMVNRFSASASEILAAAMQDYGRAIIVGSQSTYGKGTVQRFLQIDRFLPKANADVSPIGDLKITIQKFYRVNGDATQLKGVTPDIILPDRYMYTEIGEREHDYPMKWDEIAPVNYTKWTDPIDSKKINKINQKLLKADTVFNIIEEAAMMLKTRRENSIAPLNYTEFRVDNENSEPNEKIKQLGKTKTGLEVITQEDQTNKTSALDSVKKENTKRWYEDIKKDSELYHTYKLLNEIL